MGVPVYPWSRGPEHSRPDQNGAGAVGLGVNHYPGHPAPHGAGKGGNLGSRVGPGLPQPPSHREERLEALWWDTEPRPPGWGGQQGQG